MTAHHENLGGLRLDSTVPSVRVLLALENASEDLRSASAPEIASTVMNPGMPFYNKEEYDALRRSITHQLVEASKAGRISTPKRLKDTNVYGKLAHILTPSQARALFYIRAIVTAMDRRPKPASSLPQKTVCTYASIIDRKHMKLCHWKELYMHICKKGNIRTPAAQSAYDCLANLSQENWEDMRLYLGFAPVNDIPGEEDVLDSIAADYILNLGSAKAKRPAAVNDGADLHEEAEADVVEMPAPRMPKRDRRRAEPAASDRKQSKPKEPGRIRRWMGAHPRASKFGRYAIAAMVVGLLFPPVLARMRGITADDVLTMIRHEGPKAALQAYYSLGSTDDEDVLNGIAFSLYRDQRHTEARQIAERLQNSDLPRSRARGFFLSAEMHIIVEQNYELGRANLAFAETNYLECDEITRDAGVARIRIMRGNLLWRAGDLDGAEKAFRLSNTTGALSSVLIEKGEFREAAKVAGSDLESEDKLNRATAHTSAGFAYLALGDIKQAREHSVIATELGLQLNDQEKIAFSMINQMGLMIADGADLDQVKKIRSEIIDLSHKLNRPMITKRMELAEDILRFGRGLVR